MNRSHTFLDFLRALTYDTANEGRGRLSSLVNLPADTLMTYLRFLRPAVLRTLYARAVEHRQEKLIREMANGIVQGCLTQIPRDLDALNGFLTEGYPTDPLAESVERLRQAFRFKDSWLTEERVFYQVLHELLGMESFFLPALRAVHRHFDREDTARVHRANVLLTFTELSEPLLQSYFEARPFISDQEAEAERIRYAFERFLREGVLREAVNTRMVTGELDIFASEEAAASAFTQSARRAQELLHSASELVGRQTHYVRYTFADGMGEYFDGPRRAFCGTRVRLPEVR